MLSFQDYNSSDSTEICKIRLDFLTVVLGRKWAVINYLRISKWAANYKKKQMGFMLPATDLEDDLWAY